MVMALDDHGEIAGLASSLGGMFQMLAGGLMTVLLAPFFTISPMPMVIAIAICAVLTYIVLRLTAAASARDIPVV
jgi:MFS transporter, DHA1 family, multidrug resistance protein